MHNQGSANHEEAAMGLQACRVCLATSCKLFQLRTHRLAQTFGELTGIQVSAADGLPQHVCSICGSLLLKYAAFRDRCWTAQHLLQDLLLQNHFLTTHYIQDTASTHLKLPMTLTEAHILEYLPEPFRSMQKLKEETSVDGGINVNFILPLEEDSQQEIKAPNIKIEHTSEYDSDNINDIANDDDSDDNIQLDTLRSCKKRSFNKTDTAVFKTGTPDSKKLKKPQGKRVKKKLKTEDKIKKEKAKKENVKCKKKESPSGAIEKEHKRTRKKDCGGKEDNKKYRYDTEEKLTNFSKAYNVDIFMLSSEEQRKEIEARKTTSNYQDSNFKCEQCFKGFLVESTYKNHMAGHDPSAGEHVCEVCRTRFPKRHRLMTHMRCHKMNMVCKECNFISKTPCKAKQHFKWHTGVKYECEHCGKRFDKRGSHLYHVRTAHGSESCALCGDSFIGEHGLLAHMHRVHREALNSSCASCGVQFHSMDALNRHQLHSAADGCQSQNKPCAQCGDSFSTEDLLKEHIQEQHVKEIKCEKCNKTFKNEKFYRSHCFSVHRIEAKLALHPGAAESTLSTRRRNTCICEMCGMSFQKGAALRCHQLVHTGEKPHLCPECPKSFRLKQQLQEHMHTHTGERPYKCGACPKAFRSQQARIRHRLIHSQIRRHRCQQCGKTFKTSTCVKTHVNNVHLKLLRPYQYKRNRHD